MKRLFALIALVIMVCAASWAYDSDIHNYDDGLIPDAALQTAPDGLVLIGGASDNFVQVWGNGGCWDGVFDDDDLKWINIGMCGDSTLRVRADIELYVKVCLFNNKVYFHLKGDDYSPREAVLTGQIGSNHGQWLGVAAMPGYDVNFLKGTVDGFGNPMTGQTIPVSWAVDHLQTSGHWTGWVDGAFETKAGSTGYWWPIDCGHECDHPFKLKIRIAPRYHQPDGQYALDAYMAAAPWI